MSNTFRPIKSRSRHDDADIVGVIDIGTAKICCVIASRSNPPRLLGFGHQRSRGIKAGIIVNLDDAEQCVRAAVAQAERQAGVTLERVLLAVAGGPLSSIHFTAHAEIAHAAVDDSDIGRLFDGARLYAEHDGQSLVHLNNIAYHLDGSPSLTDPRGMAGRKLTADMHAVTAEEATLRNLGLLVERCFLTPERFVPSAIASARAVASAEEARAGVAVIDIGAGTTSIAVLAEGHDLFVDNVPIGGGHITFDIMSALGTPLAEAERIKVLYGSMAEAASDERDVVTYPRQIHDESELYQISKAQLRSLIKPRVESLLTQAMEKLVAGGMQAYAGERVVLTGGAAQLMGLSHFAGRFLHVGARVAAPQPLVGMASSSCSPAFATVIGLLAASANSATLPVIEQWRPAVGPGYIGRMGQWLRESF